MNRTWYYALGIFAALAIAGSAIAGATYVALHSDDGRKAVDARIEASNAADQARDSKVFAEIDADNKAAVAACENLVRDRLKAPATARFTTTSNSVAGPENGLQGLVHGTVDSQNNFGALVRSDWTCMVLPGSTASAINASIVSLVQR